MVLVDTAVWSIALRRKRPAKGDEQSVADELERLIDDDEALIIGPIRQEVLSGIADSLTFAAIRDLLLRFDNTPIIGTDYEDAARHSNACRRRGIARSPIDMLLCAVAHRLEVPIFTTDRDFIRYADVLTLKLHASS